jgi:sulfate permease, SulP family
MKPLSQARDDIFGGLVSAAIAIPLAMGYGMFAFSSLGENYFADGASLSRSRAGRCSLI